VEAANHRALHAYQLRPLDCDAVLFKTRLVGRTHPVMYDGWKTLIMGELATRTIPGGHRQMFDEPFVRTLARELAECLERRQPCARAAGAPRERAGCDAVGSGYDVSSSVTMSGLSPATRKECRTET
jgi:hypothetical protein